MWRITERELKERESDVKSFVLNGGKVAVRMDGYHDVVLSSAYVCVTDFRMWTDFIGSRFREVYEAVASGVSRTMAQDADGTIYIMPIAVVAPHGMSHDQIEQWLEIIDDEFVVAAPQAIEEASDIVVADERRHGVADRRAFGTLKLRL